MSLRLLLASTATALVALVSATPALADEGEGARLYREGRALLAEGRLDEACPKLQASQQAEPRGTTLLHVAACHEQQGKVATAWAEYHDALAAARAEGQPARVAWAEERIAAVAPQVPWVTVLVTAEAASQAASLTFDGGDLPRFTWGKEMPVDPGAHRLVIRAGRREKTRTVVVRAGERQTVEITSLEEALDPELPPFPARPAPAALAQPRSRWVLEAGLMGGYMSAAIWGGSNVRPDVDPATLGLTYRGQRSSCAREDCTYSLGTQGSAFSAVSFFAGFAPMDRLHLGARVLTGPRLRGGAVFATGPSVSLRMAGPLWIGTSAYLGYASQSERDGDYYTGGFGFENESGARAPLTASSDLLVGAGVELRCELFHNARGALSIDTQPFFLAGERGRAFFLPVGISYRWR